MAPRVLSVVALAGFALVLAGPATAHAGDTSGAERCLAGEAHLHLWSDTVGAFGCVSTPAVCAGLGLPCVPGQCWVFHDVLSRCG